MPLADSSASLPISLFLSATDADFHRIQPITLQPPAGSDVGSLSAPPTPVKENEDRSWLTSLHQQAIGQVCDVSGPMAALSDDVITSVATSWTERAWSGVNSANPVFATCKAVAMETNRGARNRLNGNDVHA